MGFWDLCQIWSWWGLRIRVSGFYVRFAHGGG